MSRVVIKFERPDKKWNIKDGAYNCHFETDTEKGTIFLGSEKQVTTKTLKVGYMTGYGTIHWLREGIIVPGVLYYSMKPFCEYQNMWGPAMPRIRFEAHEQKISKEEQVRLVGQVISESLALSKDAGCTNSVKYAWAIDATKRLVKQGHMTEARRLEILDEMDLEDLENSE